MLSTSQKLKLRRLTIQLFIGLVLLLCCGIGKANCMYFVGLKRVPGFGHSLFVKQADSAFGAIDLDDELKANYSFILFSYCDRTGVSFLRRS